MGGGIAQAVRLRALAEAGAARTAVWLYLEPLVTTAAARALASPPVAWRAVTDGRVVPVGVAVVQSTRNAPTVSRAAQPTSRRYRSAAARPTSLSGAFWATHR